MTDKRISLQEAATKAKQFVEDLERRRQERYEREAKELLLDDPVYVYKIGYGSMEESSFWEYKHDDQFTDEELSELVENCIVNTIKSGALDGLSATFQNVMETEEFHNQLKLRGFVNLEFEATTSLFGWAKCDEPEDWNTYTNEEEKKIAARIKKKLEG